MKISVAHIDFDLTTTHEFDVTVRAPGRILGAFIAIVPMNPLIAKPGQGPQVAIIPRLAVEVDPDGELVQRKFVVIPSGSGLELKEAVRLEYRALWVDESSGRCLALYEVVPDPLPALRAVFTGTRVVPVFDTTDTSDAGEDQTP
jgi:hypothetical protein